MFECGSLLVFLAQPRITHSVQFSRLDSSPSLFPFLPPFCHVSPSTFASPVRPHVLLPSSPPPSFLLIWHGNHNCLPPSPLPSFPLQFSPMSHFSLPCLQATTGVSPGSRATPSSATTPPASSASRSPTPPSPTTPPTSARSARRPATSPSGPAPESGSSVSLSTDYLLPISSNP